MILLVPAASSGAFRLKQDHNRRTIPAEETSGRLQVVSIIMIGVACSNLTTLAETSVRSLEFGEGTTSACTGHGFLGRYDVPIALLRCCQSVSGSWAVKNVTVQIEVYGDASMS